MIPGFYDGEFLPDGDHEATWQEVQDRFGEGETRRRLCQRMSACILQARACGFRGVYLFGSFISSKADPGDIDLLWIYRAGSMETMSPPCRDLLNYGKMKADFGWDMFCCTDDPDVVEYLLSGWRKNKSKTKQRGLIKIDLEKFEGIIL